MAEREFKLKISTEADGSGVRELVAQLQSLAAQGGAAAPELERIATDIAKLEDARTAAQSFGALKDSTDALSFSLEQIQAHIASLAPQLDAAKASTADYARAQTQAARESEA